MLIKLHTKKWRKINITNVIFIKINLKSQRSSKATP